MYSRIMLVGSGGVGKTSLRRSLMRQPWESGANSTVVAELHSVRPVQREWVEGMEGQWKELTHDDEIDEIAHLMNNCRPSGSLMKYNSLTTEQNLPTHTITELNSIVSKATSKAIRIQYHQVPHAQQYLHIWDSGGQPVFLDILPAFLTSRTMFLLLFDASKSLTERLPSLEYHDGKEIKGEILKMSALDLLCQWMASIYSHLARYNKRSKTLYKCPRISVIGTHRDIMEKAEHEIREQLLQQFGKRKYQELLESIVFVDNSTARKPECSGEDPNFEIIRSQVEKFTSKLKVKTPLSWVLFRKVVQALCVNIIGLEEVRAIGAHCNIPPNHIPSVLTFYHELGVVLYYPHIQGMEKKIIVNPKWLVDTIGKVFSFDTSTAKYIKISNWVDTFKTKGVLLQSLYEEIWSNSEGVKPETLMNILVRFRIAVHTSALHSDSILDVQQYFLPAVLPLSPENPPLSYDYLIQATPLHITFATNFVQPGFFSRLITTMASSSDYLVEFQNGVYCDRITFRYGQHQIDHVIMSDTPHAIIVDVHRVHGNEDGFSTVCQDLLKYIEECCETVDQCLYDISKQQILSIAVEDDDDIIPVSEAVSRQRKYQYVCGKCNDGCTVHYIDDVKGQTCAISLIHCTQDKEYRNLTKQEKYWFPSKVSNFRSRLDFYELPFIFLM